MINYDPAEIYRLHVDEKMTFKEIGLRFGLSRSAVAGVIYRYKRDNNAPSKEPQPGNSNTKPFAPKEDIPVRMPYTTNFVRRKVPEREMTKNELRDMLREAVENTR